jgi:hypothetical protein
MDIILSVLMTCKKLLKYTTEENDRLVIKKEITELKMAVGLLSIIIQGLQHCVLPLKTLELGHFSF